jgi:hypothetical protein
LQSVLIGNSEKMFSRRKVSVCSGCDGQGTVIIRRQIGPGMVQHQQARCPDCDGEGTVVKELTDNKFSAPRSISVAIDEPFSVSFQRTATGVVVDFKVGGSPKTCNSLSYLPPATSRLALPAPPLYTPRNDSAASRPMIANAAHSGSLVTMLCSVVWFDSSKGFGFAGPIEPGHPDVMISEKELHAAGVFDPEPRTLLMLTFNPSEYTVRRRPKALVVRLP